MVAQLNRLKINSCILDGGAPYEWDFRNRGLKPWLWFQNIQKNWSTSIYGTNLDGEGTRKKVWLVWGLSGILVTDWNQVDPDASQNTAHLLSITNAQRQTQLHTTLGGWLQRVDPSRHNTLYYQPEQLYNCRHLGIFQLGWYESWFPWGVGGPLDWLVC